MTDSGERKTWRTIGWGPWEDDDLPAGPLDEQTRQQRELPRTLVSVADPGVRRRPIFDPALKQYGSAMRAGEPRFAAPGTAERWHDARRRAVDHVLAAVAESPWAGHLVLRGSMLLRAWYGPAAREPGDLDFVVVPATWELVEPRTERMFADIARGADARSAAAGDVRIDAAGAVDDEIWTYDRVPGRRLVLPWRAAGLPSGIVQLDFVFNESLPTAAEYTDVPCRDGSGTHRILAATAEQSLAWKLLWLLSDSYPQGKDLYDAVLLAESTPLRAELLHRTLVAGEPHWAGRRVSAATFVDQDADWDEFVKEYPDIGGTAEEFMGRLLTALEPVFAEESAGPAVDGYAWRLRWLGQLLPDARRAAARAGMPALVEWLKGRGLGLAESIVIIREVVGPDRCTLDQAADAYVAELPYTSGELGYYTRNPEVIRDALGALREAV
ncbi:MULTISPECIES: nucleotidyl transferase AbiEii/AbiGii toxin family protein [unclassified Embleya]|uniref:nucleotidyl transferase AbiEii/AbiGii toxin family protein n=1 Tax=unclassified Embleya TaxID=2699296 RepID=UPI00340E063E